MNVYDFDKTIFAGDCSIGFCIWCMNRHPKLWITFFPKALINLIRSKTGNMPEYLMQRKFFGYLTLIDDFDVQIKKYWDKNGLSHKFYGMTDSLRTPSGCNREA